MYFKEGKFEEKFNVLAIAKDLGLYDGKTLIYETDEPLADSASKTKLVEIKARGFTDMYNKIPDEAIAWLKTRLNDAYTKQVMHYNNDKNNIEEETNEYKSEENNT